MRDPGTGHEPRTPAGTGGADLLAVLAAPTTSTSDRARAREELVHRHLSLVEHCVRRYAGRGESHDDLVQVGTIGLIKAIDRFDPGRSVAFSSFAVPTILGEIKRHFRDRGWTIRVPRRVQELHADITEAASTLTQQLGHSPTPSQIATALGVDRATVVEGIESAHAYAPLSLDAPARRYDDRHSVVDSLGEVDQALERVDSWESLRPLLSGLDPRRRQILALRFFRGMTQSAIASELGISQMHVSRLLAQTLRELREQLSETEGSNAPEPSRAAFPDNVP